MVGQLWAACRCSRWLVTDVYTCFALSACDDPTAQGMARGGGHRDKAAGLGQLRLNRMKTSNTSRSKKKKLPGSQEARSQKPEARSQTPVEEMKKGRVVGW